MNDLEGIERKPTPKDSLTIVSAPDSNIQPLKKGPFSRSVTYLEPMRR